MDQLFVKVRDVDPNNSDAVKEVLSNFFQSLQKWKDINSNRWLRELLIIINRYPKYCMSHRNIIETFLSTYLSSNNYYNVIEAAKCAQALQQVRPIEEKTATPKSSWRNHMSVLCNAAHSLIEVVFSDAVDIYKSIAKPQESHSKSPLSSALATATKKLQDTYIKDKSLLLQIRLKNVFIFIQAMLVEIYPAPKPIQPRAILDVIIRALSVSSQKVKVDVACVKIQALRSLDALILCLGSNLIPYSAIVFRLVTQTLRWSTDNVNNMASKVRCTAYNTMSNWLLMLHVYKMPDKNMWVQDLTAHVLNDITPAKKVVTLTMGAQPTKKLSRKAKRKLARSQLLDSGIAAHMPGEKNKIDVPEEVNNVVRTAALEFAEVFLTVCGSFLKLATHKLFQERLVRHYMHSDTLKYLRALEAARKSTPPALPPPTQYCLHIYSTLVNSKSAEISKFCSQALLDIRLHLYGSPVSVGLDLEIPPETEEEINRRSIISSKNRSILEYLLEAEKISEDKDSDVISIPDEPLNKKQRTGDLDKISLSSDSERSMNVPHYSEISSASDDCKEKNKCTELDNDPLKEAINRIFQQKTKIGQQQLNYQVYRNVIPSEVHEQENVVAIKKKFNIHEAPTEVCNTPNHEQDSSFILSEVHEQGRVVNVIKKITDIYEAPTEVCNTQIDEEDSSFIPSEVHEQGRVVNVIKKITDIYEAPTEVCNTQIDEEDSSFIPSEVHEQERVVNVIKKISDIHEAPTEVCNTQIDEEDSSFIPSEVHEQGRVVNVIKKITDIHDSPTEVCNTPIDEEDSSSLDIEYDYPYTGTDEVMVLEEIDSENLPSTNEIDHDQIACGQIMSNTQDIEENNETELPKVNGIHKVAENGIENDLTDSEDGVAVDDMLAAFVNESNEDVTTI